jgi:hypothetical protein
LKSSPENLNPGAPDVSGLASRPYRVQPDGDRLWVYTNSPLTQANARELGHLLLGVVGPPDESEYLRRLAIRLTRLSTPRLWISGAPEPETAVRLRDVNGDTWERFAPVCEHHGGAHGQWGIQSLRSPRCWAHTVHHFGPFAEAVPAESGDR